MKIRARDFLSWEKLEFEVGKGVTLIQGFNHDDETPEGSGKSAILNALSWGAYGKIPKDANVDEVIREDKKSTSVEIELPDFTIVRERGPNDLCIKYPSGEIHRGKDAHETQKEIVKLLGMSFETFCQSIYFAQNYPNKFVTANQEGKGKIITEILDLEQFDRARKTAADRIKTEKEKLVGVTKDYEHFSGLIEWQEDDVKEKEIMIEEFQAEKIKKVQGLFSQINSLTEEVEKFVADFTTTQERDLKEKKKEIRQIEAQQLDNSKELAELQEALKEADTKPLFLEKTHRLSDLAEHEGYRDELKVKLMNVNSEISQQEKREKELKSQEARRKSIKESMEALAQRIEEREADFQAAAEDHRKAREAAENPEKDKCPTCGQDWDGDLEHYTKEVEKAKALERRSEKDLRALVTDLEKAQANKKELDASIKALKAEVEAWQRPDTQKLERMLEGENFGVHTNKERIREIEAEMLGLEKLKLQEKPLKDRATSLEADRQRRIAEHDRLKEKSPEKDVEKYAARIAALEDQVVAEDAKEPESLQAKLKESKAKLKKLKEDLAKAGTNKDLICDKIIKLEALREGYRETKSYTFENTLSQLSNKANRYLAELFSQQVKIRFKNVDMKIDSTVTIDGTERSLALYSGGQFRRIALAVDLALADVTLARKSNKLNLIILDEYFKDLSEVSMEKVLKILQARRTPTLLIEHNSIFKAIVDQTFELELRDGVSRRIG